MPADHSTPPSPLEVGEAAARLRRSSWITDVIAAAMPLAIGALALAVGVLGYAYLRTSSRADAVVVALENLGTQTAALQETNDRLARLAEQFAVLVDRESTPEERDAARAEVSKLRDEIEAAKASAAARSGTTTSTTQPRASAPSSTSSTTAPPASASPAPSTTTTAPPSTTTTTRPPPGCALGTLPIVCPP